MLFELAQSKSFLCSELTVVRFALVRSVQETCTLPLTNPETHTPICTQPAWIGIMPKSKGGRKKATNSLGFKCVNVLVQRCIASVLRKAKSRDRGRAWNNANRDRIKKASSELYQKKRDQRIAETTSYRQKNRKRMMQAQIKREKERRDTDPQYHASVLLRQRVRQSISRQSNGRVVKSKTTLALTGASPAEIVKHLGASCETLGKRGGNDIDHIFPVTIYDLTDEEQQKMCFHISNLRLLATKANKEKSNSLPSLEEASKVERWCWPPGVDESMLN